MVRVVNFFICLIFGYVVLNEPTISYANQKGCRTEGMQDRRDSGQEVWKKVGIQDRWNTVRGIQDRCDGGK